VNSKVLEPSFTTKMARLLLSSFSLLLVIAGPALAGDNIIGDAEAGAKKAATCAACHGADGNSINPQWPNIAGQHERYLTNTLIAFKNGARKDVLMGAQAMALSDQDIADLAAYYAGQTATLRTANPQLAKAGERLYRGGDKEGSISACIACHGPAGRGNAPAGYPSVKGQHATYTAKQLSDYKSGNRVSDGDLQIMRNIVARLNQEQIDAVAAYIQGLR
jgi:cytochrome c553